MEDLSRFLRFQHQSDVFFRIFWSSRMIRIKFANCHLIFDILFCHSIVFLEFNNSFCNEKLQLKIESKNTTHHEIKKVSMTLKTLSFSVKKFWTLSHNVELFFVWSLNQQWKANFILFWIVRLLISFPLLNFIRILRHQLKNLNSKNVKLWRINQRNCERLKEMWWLNGKQKVELQSILLR